MAKILRLILMAMAWPGQLFKMSDSMGTLPDASQEGILEQFDSYASMAVFHFSVPPEVTRATWEFATFQEFPNCPTREANIVIQHGSLPVFSPDNSSFPESFYLKRTALSKLKVNSKHNPTDTEVLPVYNPLPGTWFAVAYLSPFEEQHGLWLKCRYSVGSVALWTKADSVELILPGVARQSFLTRRHFSYFKFFVHGDIDAFKLVISNCQVQVRHPRPRINPDSCIDFIDIRPRALPFHALDSETAIFNLTSEGNATFFEKRPVQGTTYYLIIVSNGEVSFDVDLSFIDCGEVGLYGKQQRDWFISERGLMWSDKYNASQPKEPINGFQLFSARPGSKILQPFNVSTSSDESFKNVWTKDEVMSLDNTCVSTFDFNRIDSNTEFTTNYILQGKSWYTNWLTVLEDTPLVTRFDTLDFLDIGGFVNINFIMDEGKVNNYMYQSIQACLSKDRVPDIDNCDQEATISVSDKDNSTLQALTVIPYPEPGKWHIGFRTKCYLRENNAHLPCPRSLKASMVSVNIHLQPCDYRPQRDTCGRHGVCAKSTKGMFRYSACTCLSGYKGWTCDDDSEARGTTNYLAKTLLLTLTNLAFLPATFLAAFYGLYTESLMYLATVIFSSLYHVCDQEAFSSTLPFVIEKACMDLYVNREVLQFCDFFSAILAFWITIISLAKLPHRIVNFLNLWGVLLVAFLVQYNRTGMLVFAVPIPLGILILLITFGVKSFKRRRPYRPSQRCVLVFVPALILAVTGFCLVGFVETSINYAYVHSTWHVLMGLSLLLLIPQCRGKKRQRRAKQQHFEDLELEEDTSGSGVSDPNSLCSDTEEMGITTSSSSTEAPPSTVQGEL